MICANFDSLANCFQIFIISKLRHYTLNQDLGFINAIIKVTSTVAKRKISLTKL